MSIFNRFFPSDNFEEVGWKTLDSMEGLAEIVSLSADKTVVIFKHSISCGTSAQVKDTLFAAWDLDEDQVIFYYLDLINNRSISNEIAERFGIRHQSPQVIVIKDGKAIDSASHYQISIDRIKAAV